MKHIIWLFMLSLAWSGCNGTKKVALNTWHGKPETQELGNGMIKEVSIDVYRDTVFVTQVDGANKIYPVLKTGKDTALIRLQVAYDLKEPMPDSRQNYVLYIPIDNPVKLSKRKALKIDPGKVLFGLQAFHPQAGYRFLKGGDISILRKDDHTLELRVNILDDSIASKLNGTYLIPVKE